MPTARVNPTAGRTAEQDPEPIADRWKRLACYMHGAADMALDSLPREAFSILAEAIVTFEREFDELADLEREGAA